MNHADLVIRCLSDKQPSSCELSEQRHQANQPHDFIVYYENAAIQKESWAVVLDLDFENALLVALPIAQHPKASV